MPGLKASIEKVVKKFLLKSTVPRPSNPESSAQDHQSDREILVARLTERHRSCYKEFETNQWYLDHRHEYFRKDDQARYARYKAGDPENETMQEIEHRQFRQTQELTRLVIEAEEELDKAEKALMESGIEVLGPEYGSECGDDFYRISELVGLCEPGKDQYVQKWLKDVPGSRQGEGGLLSAFDHPKQPVEIDAWYGTEPDMWESGSTLAEGRERKKIDWWTRQAQATFVG